MTKHYEALALIDEKDAEIAAFTERVRELQVARIGDAEIIGRWQCEAEKLHTENTALREALEDVKRDITNYISRKPRFCGDHSDPKIICALITARIKAALEQKEARIIPNYEPPIMNRPYEPNSTMEEL